MATLYRDNVDRLRRYLTSKLDAARAGAQLDVISPEDVDDIVHEVFARCLESEAFAALEDAPLPYLLTATKNRWIDWTRRRRRERAKAALRDSAAENAARRERCDVQDPHECFERHRRQRSLAACLAGLSQELLAVFEQRYLTGLSQRDAAVTLGITRRRVRTLEQRLARLLDGC